MPSQSANLSQGSVSDAPLTTSLIIPTRDRPATLHDTLTTVLQQTIPPAEIIIIDQSKTRETRNIVDGVAEAHKDVTGHQPRFLYHYDPHLKGAGAARNIGIRLSSCPILLFLDDDVLLEPDFIEAILSVYQQHPLIGGVSGIITNYERPSFRERLLEQLFCLGPFHDERLPLYWNVRALDASEPIAIRKVSGCVMSVRRQALGDQTFDANYRGAGAEDVDLSWRISQSFPILLTPGARLQHLRTRSGPQRQHWLTSVVSSQYYLYYRLWRRSLLNRLCFAWLNLGFLTVAAASSMRRRSLVPLHALLAGIRQSHDLLWSRPEPVAAGPDQ